MIDKIAKLVFDYSKNEKMADENFVRSIIEIVVREKELSDWLKEIKVSKSINMLGTSSNYDVFEKKILIRLIDAFLLNKKSIPAIFVVNKNVILYNIMIVFCILHELDHVDCFKRISDGEQSIDVNLSKMSYTNVQRSYELNEVVKNNQRYDRDEFRKLMTACLKYRSSYTKNHDMSPFEKRANISSLLGVSKVLEMLSDTSLSSDDLDYTRLESCKIFIKKSLYGYKSIGEITNSPSVDFVKNVGTTDEELRTIDTYDPILETFYNNARDKYSIQERITYGLPLSKEELDSVTIDSNPFNAYQKRR